MHLLHPPAAMFRHTPVVWRMMLDFNTTHGCGML